MHLARISVTGRLRPEVSGRSRFGPSPLLAHAMGSIATFAFGSSTAVRRGVSRDSQPLTLKCSCVGATARPRRNGPRSWAARPQGHGRKQPSARARARRHIKTGGGGPVSPPRGSGGVVISHRPQPAAQWGGGGAVAPPQAPRAPRRDRFSKFRPCWPLTASTAAPPAGSVAPRREPVPPPPPAQGGPPRRGPEPVGCLHKRP